MAKRTGGYTGKPAQASPIAKEVKPLTAPKMPQPMSSPSGVANMAKGQMQGSTPKLPGIISRPPKLAPRQPRI